MTRGRFASIAALSACALARKPGIAPARIMPARIMVEQATSAAPPHRAAWAAHLVTMVRHNEGSIVRRIGAAFPRTER